MTFHFILKMVSIVLFKMVSLMIEPLMQKQPAIYSIDQFFLKNVVLLQLMAAGPNGHNGMTALSNANKFAGESAQSLEDKALEQIVKVLRKKLETVLEVNAFQVRIFV